MVTNISSPIDSSSLSAFSPIWLKDRMDFLLQKIDFLKNNLHVSEGVKVELETKDDPRAFNRLFCRFRLGIPPVSFRKESNFISLPFWYLLNYEEIPLEFRNINLNDDKTVELQLDKFAKWLTALSEKTGHPLTFERKDLKLLIWHLRSREVFEKSNDFVIAHEMSHLIEGNMPDQNLILKGAKITGIALTVLSLVLIPFVNIGIATALIITALTITILATLILRKQMEHARQCEKNCDISAAKVLKDIDGGMHTFESERLYTLSLRNLLPSCLKWFLNEQGNNTYDDTHPLLTERIDYLKKWKEDNLGANNLQDKPFHNYLREKVHALPIERQNRLYFRIWDFAGKPQTHDLQWGEHHAYNNWDRLAAALRQA